MVRTTSIVLACAILAAAVMSACAPITPPPTLQSTPVLVPITGTPIATVFVVPTTVPTAAASPAATDTTVAQPMPALQDISWQTAQEMILGGQVTAVSQAHSLQVSLTLRDGRVLHTVEPQIDEVIRVVNQCGEACRDITIATE